MTLDIGKAVRDWRTRHGVSHQGLADALGIARRALMYYEKGDRDMPWQIPYALAALEAKLGPWQPAEGPEIDRLSSLALAAIRARLSPIGRAAEDAGQSADG